MKKIWLILAVLALGGMFSGVSAQCLRWRSFEESLVENGVRSQMRMPLKKVFIDVYTDWCGWCKRLDATTFSHPEIVRYMDSAFITVKLNAERTDTVYINGNAFVNQSAASGKRGSHDLAIQLLQGKMSYPSCTFLDEKGQQITVVPGYMDAKQFEVLLHFVAEEAYKTTSWEDFSAAFAPRAKVQ
ncbi:MAG: thioredoxin family protein [Bacteroides sp.]|nr:thioredoxin family protein [Bacteroides sp.]